MNETQTGLGKFHGLIREWFLARKGEPTDVQNESWLRAFQGESFLITAPTGSGKTLAAFLCCIDAFTRRNLDPDVLSVLYVSPLKALNNDIRKNLLKPIAELNALFSERGEVFPDISVMVRSGDTPQNERRKMVKRPPSILITTPESLSIMLNTESTSRMFETVRLVILDEIHALFPAKRGSFLAVSLERIALIAGEFQRIAVSATVHPIEKVAEFVGGAVYDKGELINRKIGIVRSLIDKKIDIAIRTLLEIDYSLSDTVWERLAQAIIQESHDARSVLVFVNARRYAEKLAFLVNERAGETIAWAHHGSLSRETRLDVETRLKNGDLKIICATNSLELGIDVGSIDRVILAGTPFRVSQALQRAGRAGHSVGGVSSASLYPIHGTDFLYAEALMRAVGNRRLEPEHAVRNPYDILAQVILCCCLFKPIPVDELYLFLRRAYPFRELDRAKFDSVLAMLAGKYSESRVRELESRVFIDTEERTVMAKKGVQAMLYSSGGTIPERGYFKLRMEGSRTIIGDLDEEFVWERRLGDTFALGTKTWKIVSMNDQDVYVQPTDKGIDILPFWKAFAQNRGEDFMRIVREILHEADTESSDLEDPDGIREPCGLEPFLKRAKAALRQLPHDTRIVVERFKDPAKPLNLDQFIIHTFWGGEQNQPFSLILADAFEERYGFHAAVYADDASVVLAVPDYDGNADIVSLIREVSRDDSWVKNLERRLVTSGSFGSAFRENAGRAMLLPKPGFGKRVPLWMLRMRSKKLFEAVKEYRDFPITEETWRTCLEEMFDVGGLGNRLQAIDDMTLGIFEIKTIIPSPFARGIIWQETSSLLYQTDEMRSPGNEGSGEAVIKAAIGEARYRPVIERELASSVGARLKRLEEGWEPDTREDFFEWIDERILVPRCEAEKAISKLTGFDSGFHAWLGERTVYIKGDGTDVLIATKGNFRIIESLMKRAVPNDYPKGKDLSNGNPQGKIGELLRFEPPFLLGEICDKYFLDETAIAEICDAMVTEGILVKGDLYGKNEERYCDADVYESILRRQRKIRRKDDKAFAPGLIMPFLWEIQGNRLAQATDRRDRLLQALETLFYLPIPVLLFERWILPARVVDYRPADLDEVFSNTGLSWAGCGNGVIYLSCDERTGKGYSFWDFRDSSGMTIEAATEALWAKAWSGWSCDSYQPLREGVRCGFKYEDAKHDGGTLKDSVARMKNRWKSGSPMRGTWHGPHAAGLLIDSLDEEESFRQKIRVLFSRYGMLNKDLLSRELPELSWRFVFRSLRYMELSGEIYSGHFFEGLASPQFMSKEGWNIFMTDTWKTQGKTLNACDPASPAGFGSAGNLLGLPSRIQSNKFRFSGGFLTGISARNDRELTVFSEPSSAETELFFSDIRRLGKNPDGSLEVKKIETINGVMVDESPYRKPLENAGFSRGYKVWESF